MDPKPSAESSVLQKKPDVLLNSIVLMNIQELQSAFAPQVRVLVDQAKQHFSLPIMGPSHFCCASNVLRSSGGES